MTGFFERMGARAVGAQPRWGTRPRTRFEPGAAPEGIDGTLAGGGPRRTGTEPEDDPLGGGATVFDGGRTGAHDPTPAPGRAGQRGRPRSGGQHPDVGPGGPRTVPSGIPSVPAPGEPGTRESTPSVPAPGEPVTPASVEPRYGAPPDGVAGSPRLVRPSSSRGMPDGEPHLAGTAPPPGPRAVRQGRGEPRPGPAAPARADPARAARTVDSSAPASRAPTADDPLRTSAFPQHAGPQQAVPQHAGPRDLRETGERHPAASMEAPAPDQIGRSITEALREARLLGPAEIADTLVGDRAGTAVSGTLRPGHAVVRTGEPRTDPQGGALAGPAAGPPQMHVHIDRVQVQRAAPPGPDAPAPAAPARPGRLAAYLKGRDER